MVYDYRCRDCENIWQERHSMKVDNAVEELGLKCPECESVDIYKYLGNVRNVSIKFLGTGWAGNDAALEAIGMPEATRNSPEAKKRLFK